jgi:hypothetical protein
MSASPEAIRAIRSVARHLDDLCNQVVFVGGVVRGLLITDPAVRGSRPTKDVDVIVAGIATRADYYSKIHTRLRLLGFQEDTSEGAPLCRWKLEDVIVDVMPSVPDVLGFSNRWYVHAVETANTITLPHVDADASPINVRVVTAPSFIATKLAAFANRGGGDYEGSHDIEDIVAVIDGRPSMVEDVEDESDDLRTYVAEELSRHLSAGLPEAVPGHLAGDSGSQGRAPFVLCAFDRLARKSRRLAIGVSVQSKHAGQPGANGPLALGPWRYEIVGVERRTASAARDHVIVRATLTNLSRTAAIVGDGRDVFVEDMRGIRFPPLYMLNVVELMARGLPGIYDQVVPGEPFETCWVYELPQGARSLRLILPFDQYELLLP